MGWSSSSTSGDEGNAGTETAEAAVKGNWDSESEASIECVDEVAPGPSESFSEKGGRGRPKGTKGGHSLRSNLKQAAEQRQADALAAMPRPGSIEYARAARLEEQRQNRLQQQALQASRGFEHHLPLRVGNLAQRCINATVCKALEQQINTTDAVVDFFLCGDSLTTSAAAVSSFLGTSKTHVQRTLVGSASAVLHIGASLWGAWLSILNKMSTGDAATFEPVLLVEKLKYDETPSKVRVLETSEATYMSPVLKKSPEELLLGDDLAKFKAAIGSTTDVQTATHAKVLQTQHEVATLLRNKQSGDYCFVRGQVPTNLQVMDRTTGENIQAALLTTLQAHGSV